MKSYKVGICDRDMDFATALMDYINANAALGISVIAFSGMQAVRDYIVANDMDLLITDSIQECEETEKGRIFCDIKVTEFSEYPEKFQGTLPGNAYIYKYQPVSAICKLIQRQLIDEERNVRKISECIGVYSPVGRCGATRLAKGLAGYDEVRGGLYIGMENYSDNIRSLESSVLYLLKIKSPELTEALMTNIINEAGVNCLYTAGSFLDTKDITQNDFVLLKEELLKSGRFTSLVFDMGSAAISDISILRCFDKIYMPVLTDGTSIRKIEIFLKILKEQGYRDVIRKITRVDVPAGGSNEIVKTIWNLNKEERNGFEE